MVDTYDLLDFSPASVVTFRSRNQDLLLQKSKIILKFNDKFFHNVKIMYR